MTWLDLDSLGQNNQPIDWTFLPIDCLFLLTKRLLIFHQSIAFLSKPLPLFRQAISNHKSIQPITTLFQAISLVSWPTSPSDCSPYLSDCLAYPSDCHFWASDWLLADNYSRVLLGFRHLFTP